MEENNEQQPETQPEPTKQHADLDSSCFLRPKNPDANAGRLAELEAAKKDPYFRRWLLRRQKREEAKRHE